MGRPLVFALNGERVELEAVDPRTTLLSYIRSQPGLTGTKQGCGEGNITS
jgi:xanthine dehydrogenase iron-sulfur cluster and FAD-binding subunit A